MCSYGIFPKEESSPEGEACPEEAGPEEETCRNHHPGAGAGGRNEKAGATSYVGVLWRTRRSSHTHVRPPEPVRGAPRGRVAARRLA